VAVIPVVAMVNPRDAFRTFDSMLRSIGGQSWLNCSIGVERYTPHALVMLDICPLFSTSKLLDGRSTGVVRTVISISATKTKQYGTFMQSSGSDAARLLYLI
jgi:hypothetical protein